MKKLILTLALAAAGLAQAQNVQVYGVAGAGVVSGSGFTSSNSDFQGFVEQLHNSNRFGVRGAEDLGGGMTAKFTLEANYSLRTGAMGKDSAGTGTTGTSVFDREANMALAGNFGQVQLGRGKNFLYQIADEFDSRGNWNLGGLKPVARYAGFYGGSGISRFDNMVRYTSPDLSGFKFDYAYSFGNQPGDTSYKTSYNTGVRYTAGPFDVAYTHEEARLTNAVVSEKIDLAAVSYQVTPALKVNVGYAETRNPTAQTNYYASSTKADGKTDANTWFTGAKYKVSDAVSLNAGYYQVTDLVNSDRKDNITMKSVGAVYNFSKRTELFVDYVVADRGASAASPFTIYDRWVPDAGGTTYSDSTKSQKAVAVGIQHRF